MGTIYINFFELFTKSTGTTVGALFDGVYVRYRGICLELRCEVCCFIFVLRNSNLSWM